VQRASPPPPWWALTRYGMCQSVLGFPDSALAAFERALPIAPTQVDKSATLNNLGQISRARGDYATALYHLDASLAIRRQIGDKAGEGRALYNMGHIAWEAQNMERAMTLWRESFALARETQDAQGLFHTAGIIGQVLVQVGAESEARPWLQLAVEVGKAAGFAGVQELEAVLRRLPSAEV
jgi:tetratricopeptide (TPR) repeat protein